MHKSFKVKEYLVKANSPSPPTPIGSRYVRGRDGVHSLQRSMRTAAAAGLERSGPLLFFAGGITSFSASQVGYIFFGYTNARTTSLMLGVSTPPRLRRRCTKFDPLPPPHTLYHARVPCPTLPI